MNKRAILGLLLFVAGIVAAQTSRVPDAAQFVGAPKGQPLVDPALTHRTNQISALLRCPVCQGLAVADSPAEMAVNMKGQVRELLARGYTEEQILEYFERSYGQFVLLKPKFQGVTAAIWVIPILALLAGTALTFLSLKKLGRKPSPAAPLSNPISDPYLSRVRELVGDKS